MGVVVVDHEDADDGGCEGEQADETGDEESDDEHEVGMRSTGKFGRCRLGDGQRTTIGDTHLGRKYTRTLKVRRGGQRWWWFRVERLESRGDGGDCWDGR